MQHTALLRFRPRIGTLIVFILVAAAIVLANLTHADRVVLRGVGVGGRFDCRSYGWPLLWHRYVSALTNAQKNFVRGTIGWYWSVSRLAANAAAWVMMLAVSTAACEWSLRRYPFRPRWSLRAMFGFVALAGVILAWFATIREQTRIKDAIFARETEGEGCRVRRLGPAWLGLLLDDYRYLGQLTYLRLNITAENGNDLRFLSDLKRLRTLKHLEIDMERVTPDATAALSELRQVEALCIQEHGELDDDDPVWRKGLEILGKLTWLKSLQMCEPVSRGRRLVSLAALPNLKSLRIDGSDDQFDTLGGHSDECLKAIGGLSQLEFLELNWFAPSTKGIESLAGLSRLKLLNLEFMRERDGAVFAGLPALPRLATISVQDRHFGDRDLNRLADMPALKALRLYDTEVTTEALREFGSRSSIEELVLDNDLATADGLEALDTFRHLKSLHLSRHSFGGNPRWARLTLNDRDDVTVLEQDLDRCRRALRSLRDAHPEIVIDADIGVFWSRHESQVWPGRRDDDASYRWSNQRWLPGPGDLPMTPAHRAAFEKAGGWASFSGAGVRDHDGYAFAVTF